MRDQLKLLEELQRYDARLQDIEAAVKALPEGLASDKADLARIEQMLERERGQLRESERYHGELETQLRAEETQISKSKQKLAQVKNTKEYLATQRELETVRQMATDRESELIKLMEAIETFKKSIAAHEQDVEKLRAHLASTEQKTLGEIETLKGEAGGLRGVRDGLAKNVRADVMKRYAAIRIRRGLAVVPVHAGVCGGCNMSIPPQLYNQLQRLSSLETCPNCHRIIYWDRLMEPPAEPKAGDADGATPK